MYIIFISIIITAIVILAFNRREPIEERIGMTIFGCLFATFFGVIVSLVVGSFVDDKVYNYEVKIISLKNASSLNGNFVLGTGTLSGQFLYSMYIKQNDGSIYLYHVPTKQSVIYEDSSLIDYGILHTTRTASFDDRLSNWFLQQQNSYSYSLTVPSGTVMKDMKLE